MDIRSRLIYGNRQYIENSDAAVREKAAAEGQRPQAIIVCCSDSRVIPERIFSADIGAQRDPYKACCLNVQHAVERFRNEFAEHPEVDDAVIEGAVYDIRTGEVKWL
ncbi:MAG: hypothetical protein II936_00790 [Oscillospiraceae bacterium]|nr:hypothetical protein [Oscillospiraceae bacterium]